MAACTESVSRIHLRLEFDKADFYLLGLKRSQIIKSESRLKGLYLLEFDSII